MRNCSPPLSKTRSSRSRPPAGEDRRRGAAAVEFTIVSIVFFILLFAGIEFSNLNNIRNTANNASYEAARILVVPGAARADGEAEARRLMSIVGANNITVNVTPAAINQSTKHVTVRITLNYADNTLLVPRFAAGATVTSETTLATERYDGIPAP